MKVFDDDVGGRIMTGVGKLLCPIRATATRSRLAATDLDAPAAITVTSSAFLEGSPIPKRHAGKGVGDNVSPELRWTGVPAEAAALVLLLEDVDVPLLKPLLHCVAVLGPTTECLAEGQFTKGTIGLRMVPTMLSRNCYSGPLAIPGHGPHHYRFHVLALGRPVQATDASVKKVLAVASSHVLARGTLIGTYER